MSRPGGTSKLEVTAEHQALCDKVKAAVETHPDVQEIVDRYGAGTSGYSSFICREALSQVVAGTCWYFSVFTEGTVPARRGKMKKFPAKTETGNIWIKVFDQPWTNTLQVVGVLTGKEGEELEYFGSNCQIDVPAKRSYQEVNGPVPRVDIFDENGLAQQTSGPPVQADSPALDALCADLERVKSEKGAEQDDKQDDQPRYPPRRRERVAPMCCRMLGVVNGRPHPPARALDAPCTHPLCGVR